MLRLLRAIGIAILVSLIHVYAMITSKLFDWGMDMHVWSRKFIDDDELDKAQRKINART